MSATLPVTLDLLRLVEKTLRAMVAEERKPLGKRDPRPAIRLYAMTEVLALMLDADNIPVDKDDPQDVLSELTALVGRAVKGDPAAALRGVYDMNRGEH